MTTRATRHATSSGIEALGDRDLMKQLVQEALQECLAAELPEALGAKSGERTVNRLGYRAGSDSRDWSPALASSRCGCRKTARGGFRRSCLPACPLPACGEGLGERGAVCAGVDPNGEGDY